LLTFSKYQKRVVLRKCFYNNPRTIKCVIELHFATNKGTFNNNSKFRKRKISILFGNEHIKLQMSQNKHALTNVCEAKRGTPRSFKTTDLHAGPCEKQTKCLMDISPMIIRKKIHLQHCLNVNASVHLIMSWSEIKSCVNKWTSLSHVSHVVLLILFK